jgi:hypothetical protein
LWKLFFEQQQPLNRPRARGLSLSHRRLQDAQSEVEARTTGEASPKKPSSIPPSEYINTASLRDTLQALREKNRDKFLGLETPPSNEVEKKSSEVDILFEDRQFDINKFSFPQHRNFENPSSDDSERPASDEKSDTRPFSISKVHDTKPNRPPHQTKEKKIAKQKLSHTAAEVLEYQGMYVRPLRGDDKIDQEYPWTKNIPSDVQGMAR